MCTCCRANEKTRDHIFNSGPRALHVWNFLQAPLGITGQSLSLKHRCLMWWKQVSRNPLLRMVYQITPSIICWFLWRARNEERFNSSKTSPSFIILNIVRLISSCVQLISSKKNYITDCWYVLLDSILQFKWKITALQVPWSIVQEGHILNTDGSSMFQGSMAAGGGILRDSNGGFIFAFSAFFGYGSNMCAETISLLVGLSICEKFQVNKVEVRADSKALIDILNKNAMAPWHIQPLIRKIS